MKRFSPVLSAVSAALFAAGSIFADESSREDIDRAVAAVYPALVRIHVVAEEGSEGRMRKLQGIGSGTIISDDGYILTNHHVARRATRLVCRLSNREEVDATLVGTDALADIAVLKLDLSTRRDPAAALPTAKFGNSDVVRVGDVVLAMGSPAGLSQSVTKGIVANTEMIAPANMGGMLLDGENVGELVRWIGHDAVIYPGNSGGPLVNLKGEIVGVNEVGIGSLGGAIPGNLAKAIADELVKNGKITRSWVGIEVQPLLRGMSKEKGILVAGAVAEGPAKEAGIASGDFITEINGRPVVDARSPEDVPLFNQMLLTLPVGSKLALRGIRDGRDISWTLTTREREPARSSDSELRGWGLTAQNLSLFDALEARRKDKKGVMVDSLRPGGPASEAKPSLQVDDVITKVDGKPVENLQALRDLTMELTRKLTATKRALVTYERDDSEFLTVVKIGPEPEEDKPSQPDKSWIGLETQVVGTELAEALQIAGKKGVRVTHVLPESPAEKAGVKKGDIFLKLDGQVIAASRPDDSDLFENLIRAYKPGDEVEINAMRDGKPAKLSIKLGLRPKTDAELKEYKDDRFEFLVRELSFTRRVEAQLTDDEHGVLVDNVQPGGWASLAGLSGGDILLSVDGMPVPGISELKKRLQDFRTTRPKRVVFFIKHGIHHKFIEVEPQW
jgi:serine protease Do